MRKDKKTGNWVIDKPVKLKSHDRLTFPEGARIVLKDMKKAKKKGV
jgi:hypothetical protein